MSCGSFDLWIVSDDSQDRHRAREHAETCPRCRTILSGQRKLADRLEEWRDETPTPPDLEARLRRRLEQAQADGDFARPSHHSGSEEPWNWKLYLGALAASLVIGAGLALLQVRWEPRVPVEAGRLLVVEALEAAEDAEKAHALAIARLELAAGPILAAARDPEVSGPRAARLLEYESRLASLDTAILEVQGFLNENPGNPRARTVLLATYQEKTDVLRQVLALEERS